MSIRWLFALVSGVLLAAAFFSIVASMNFLESHLVSLLPQGADATARAIHFLLLEQALGLFLFGVLLVVVLFSLLSIFIASPLRKIVKAVQAYIANGTLVEISELTAAPREIRTLALEFSDFISKVEATHKRDSDISRVKSDFISTAAHQLRTPLTGIRWSLEALEKEPLTENQKTLVKSATDKSHDLVAIVGTLLDISSIESGKYKYTFEAVDMDAVLREVSRDFALLAKKTEVQLLYEGNEKPLPLVRADRERIKWVLNNLIENAIRYTPPGGSVRLSSSTAATFVLVNVHDTGIGISPKDRNNIFERFYRADNAIVKENQGNGLGLYIARTIATDHGGDLNFNSNADSPGTTFTLSLPIAA